MPKHVGAFYVLNVLKSNSFGKYIYFRNIHRMNDVSSKCTNKYRTLEYKMCDFCFRKMRGTSWEAGDKLAFQNGLCSVGLPI